MSNKDRKKEARKAIRKWLFFYKAARGCSNCEEKRVATLDFHHLDQSTKSIEINEAIRMRWSQASIQKEIGKCRLLCANCHRCIHDNFSRESYIYRNDAIIFDNFVIDAKGTR
jgi:hypothetical protein